MSHTDHLGTKTKAIKISVQMTKTLGIQLNFSYNRIMSLWLSE